MKYTQYAGMKWAILCVHGACMQPMNNSPNERMWSPAQRETQVLYSRSMPPCDRFLSLAPSDSVLSSSLAPCKRPRCPRSVLMA